MGDNDEAEHPKRDRGARRSARGRGAGFRSGMAAIGLELVGEVVFAAVVVLVSFLIFGELNGYFAGGVFLGVNAVLLVLALIAFVVRRSRRRR